jgi:GNAT superfamily N-acetyltransferase
MTATCDVCGSPNQNNAGLLVLPLVPADLPAVSAMTARCRRETIYHRFHGFIDLRTYLAGLLDSEQTTVVAWSEGDCVGLASLAPGPVGHEVGVLVEDRWQRRGVGAALFESLVGLAKGEGLDLLHADVLFEDAFSLRLLGRYGRLRVALEHGEYSVFVQLEETPVRDVCSEFSPGTTGNGAEPRTG